MSNKKTKIFNTFSEKETQELAKDILNDLLKKASDNKPLVLALKGNLGSGKTTFTQGIARALGVKNRITSPTFVIFKKFPISNFQFPNKKYLYHIDCYRLSKSKEILELGFQEIIANSQNIVVIEWPEKIKKLLPKHAIFLRFKFINQSHRQIKF